MKTASDYAIMCKILSYVVSSELNAYGTGGSLLSNLKPFLWYIQN